MVSLPRFFDDPVAHLNNWLINMEQRQMRTAVKEKYKGAVPEQVYWITGSDNDRDGLSSDPVESTVQRLTASQAGVYMAQRVWSKRVHVVLPILTLLGLFMAWVMFSVAPESSSEYLLPSMIAVTIWAAVLVGFAATMFAPLMAQFFLPTTALVQDEIDAIKATIKRAVVRDLPPDTPPDLADRARVLAVDAEGRAVAGQVLATDMEYSALRAEWVETKNLLRLVALAFAAPALALGAAWAATVAYYLFRFTYNAAESERLSNADGEPPTMVQTVVHFGLIPAGIYAVLSGASWGPISIALQLAMWVFVLAAWALVWYFAAKAPSPLGMRALMLDQAVRESGTELLIDKAGKAHFVSLEEARAKQLANAMADKSPFIPLGTSTGLLAQRRDPLAPSEPGLPVGLTINDLSTHLLVLGGSGTGKTSGVIRPVTRAWLKAEAGGLLALDGKGALPLELQGISPSYRLVSPRGEERFNPILGMKPDTVADTLADVLSGDSDGEPIWRDSARLMLRMAARVVSAHPALPYTFAAIQRLCVMSDEDRMGLLKSLADQIDSNAMMESAAHYWLVEVPAMPDKTLGSIVNMVRTWLGNITQHEVLATWTDTEKESSVRIDDCFTGAQIGLLLPESEYGQGGVAISALCMRRLYDAAKRRGDKWAEVEGQRPVLLAADEVQNLLTRTDLETQPVARSLGLYLMMATQNIDGLYKRLERDGTVQMLGNFASLVALPPRTSDSNSYIAKRATSVWRSVVSMYQGLPDAAADFGLYNNSGVDKVMQSVGLFRRSRLGAPRLSYAIGLWHRAWTPKAYHSLQELSLADDAQAAQQPRPNLTMDVVPLVDADEFDTLLARPHTAIALLNRGRVQRRDVIQLGEMFQ